MPDSTLDFLVNKWCMSLDYQSAFSVICEVADYLGLSQPQDYKDYRIVLNYIATNYPGVYLEATKTGREFWNIH